MPSLADAPDLVGFFSYSREDDEDSGGKLSKLRERIQAELRGHLGRTKRDFRLWQDKVAIAHGKLWEDEIKSAIAESVFFIPIVTPTAVRSPHCKFEFDSFLAREKELGRNDLVFPIVYIPVPALRDEDLWRHDPLLVTVGSRQYEQWQSLRHLDGSSPEVAARIEQFCANICKALQQRWLSPEESQQAQAQQQSEDECGRREKLRQADTIRRDEGRGRLEEKRNLDLERQHPAYGMHSSPPPLTLTQSVREHSTPVLVEGVVLVALGFIAIVIPPTATLAVVIYLGWLFLIGGTVGLVTTFWKRHAPGFWWSLLSAVLAIAVAIILLGWPISGPMSLALLLIGFFTISGILSIMSAHEHYKKELSGWWGWTLIGIIDLILAVAAAIFWSLSVYTSPVAVKSLVSINMVFGGAAMIVMALSKRHRHRSN